MSLFLVIFLVILFIIIATVKFKIHPVFSLIVAALCTGLSMGAAPTEVLDQISKGFGETLSGIGLIIAFGTIIGVFLEKTGGTQVIATTMLNAIGIKRAPLAMNLTGFLVAIPVFCDSGFIILSSLNKALSTKTGIAKLVFAIALASGLYTAHVFVPPTPGPLVAAEALGADLGSVLLYGLLVAIPVSLVGYFWARFIGKRLSPEFVETATQEEVQDTTVPNKITPLATFMPLFIPLVLIALQSVAKYPTHPFGEGTVFTILSFVGHPIIALFIGAVLAMFLGRKAAQEQRSKWIVSALKEAGVIILITGAGGAFGTVLRALKIEKYLQLDANAALLGLCIAFLIAAVLKTAQGSSTVAIITTAAIMAPLLGSLGLDTDMGKTFGVLAIGAGAMTVSHINDSYFWVVTQFSGTDVKTALKSHTLATLLQGITGIVVILLLYTVFK